MENKKNYALILGVSSGFGKSTALELAKKGYNIYGAHLDMGNGRKMAEEFRQELENLGVKATFYNRNAADDKVRKEIIDDIKEDLGKNDGVHQLRVVVHSLAFGAIKPFFSKSRDNMVNRKGIEMTMDVMANSFLYWIQDLFFEKLLAENSRIFAMSSIGASRTLANYGAISAAKAALEAYVRQVAVDLARYKVTANTIVAGLTDTPAGMKIPGFAKMLEDAKHHNPFNRNTVPEDVAQAIGMLTDEKFYWITGQTINVDGGENILNFLDSDAEAEAY
jgi:enoyl-[acyl-carrier-protein] reductase (NADH)